MRGSRRRPAARSSSITYTREGTVLAHSQTGRPGQKPKKRRRFFFGGGGGVASAAGSRPGASATRLGRGLSSTDGSMAASSGGGFGSVGWPISAKGRFCGVASSSRTASSQPSSLVGSVAVLGLELHVRPPALLGQLDLDPGIRAVVGRLPAQDRTRARARSPSPPSRARPGRTSAPACGRAGRSAPRAQAAT